MKYLIPSQTRTLFFTCHNNYKILNKVEDKNFFNIKHKSFPNYTQYSFKLNLPVMEAEEYQEYEYAKKEWRLFAINNYYKKCYVPLPNIYLNGKVCIDTPYSFKDFLNNFYNHSFNFSLISTMHEYTTINMDCDTNRNVSLLLFLQKWQDEGTVNLIEEY